MSKNKVKKVKSRKLVGRSDVVFRAALCAMFLVGHVLSAINASSLALSVAIAVPTLGVAIWTLTGLKRFATARTMALATLALLCLTGVPVLLVALGS